MLRGHVDQITRRHVIGWAADDERPDEVLDVCLFVNGVKTAQIAANMLRGDLKDPKRFGRGAHGFRYEFPPEIQEEPEIKVSVRFASTGGLLGSGDAVLRGNQSVTVSVPVEVKATMPAPQPATAQPATAQYAGPAAAPSADGRLRPLDWPPIDVEVKTSAEHLAAMLGRVESMFRHLGEADANDTGAVPEKYLAALITERDPAFFEFGKTPVRQLLATLERCRLPRERIQTCLELGCGIGRSTVWLAEQFSKIIAVDISAPHLRATQANVQRFGRNNVEFFHANHLDSLRNLPPLDLFFSMVVLQHNPPPIMRHVLGILLSKLNQGGLGYFQIPTYRRRYSFSAEKYLSAPLRLDIPEMHVFPQPELHEMIEEQGCRLIEWREDPIPGEHISARILLQKK